MGCPDCEPGDVEVHDDMTASCTLCGGGFDRDGGALLRELSFDDAKLAALPAESSKCPVCDTPFRKLVAGGATVHACTRCSAVWGSPGAVARARGRAAPAPAPAPAAPAAAPAARPPSTLTARPPPERRRTAVPRSATSAEVELRAIHAAGNRPVSRVAVIVVVLAALAAIGWALRPIPGVDVGAGVVVHPPWRGAPQREAITIGAHSGTRWRWDHGRARVEAVAIPAPKASDADAALLALYGPIHLQEGRGQGLFAGSEQRLGAVRMIVGAGDVIFLSASAADDGSFAASADARGFLEAR